MENKMAYWHLCSQELPDKLIFRTKNEYVTGMNSIPLAMQGTNITIYCFALMSNHFHFLLSGKKEQVKRFFLKLKIRLGKMLYSNSPDSPLNNLRPTLVMVNDEEHFRVEVAYILRNCAAAGICDPYTYRWNTGYLYFNPRLQFLNSTKVGNMPPQALRSILHTKIALPDDYRIAEGMILPESYVDYHKVEDVFGKSLDLFAILRNWQLEQKESLLSTGTEHEMYDDETLLELLQSEFRIFHVSGFEDMKPAMRRRFVPIMRNKYGSPVSQIRRFTGLDEKTIRRFGGW